MNSYKRWKNTSSESDQPEFKRSPLDSNLYVSFLGEKGNRKYLYRLKIVGEESSVKAFEAWCHNTLERDFRTILRMKGQFSPLFSQPVVNLTMDFRDLGKYALTKLQWS